MRSVQLGQLSSAMEIDRIGCSGLSCTASLELRIVHGMEMVFFFDAARCRIFAAVTHLVRRNLTFSDVRSCTRYDDYPIENRCREDYTRYRNTTNTPKRERPLFLIQKYDEPVRREKSRSIHQVSPLSLNSKLVLINFVSLSSR